MSASRYSKASREAAEDATLSHCPPYAESQRTTTDHIPDDLFLPRVKGDEPSIPLVLQDASRLS